MTIIDPIKANEIARRITGRNSAYGEQHMQTIKTPVVRVEREMNVAALVAVVLWIVVIVMAVSAAGVV